MRRFCWISFVLLLGSATACDDEGDGDANDTRDTTNEVVTIPDADGEVLVPDTVDTAEEIDTVDASDAVDEVDSADASDAVDEVDSPDPSDGIDEVDAPGCTDDLVAVAGARMRVSGTAFGPSVVAEPMGQIELTGEDSHASNGATIAEYRWRVVEAPPNHHYPFVPSDRVANPSLTLGPIGDYVIELVVVDQDGRSSCTPARVEARAVFEHALVIELTWRTPSDEDETDTGIGRGSDLDLHFMSPGGFWTDSPGLHDCHQGIECEWGSPTSTADNPISVFDDRDGGGPELIFLSSPVLTDGTGTPPIDAPYQIGVDFALDHGYSPAFATVRVFLDGSIEPSAVWPSGDAGEQARELVQNDFWVAGSVDWTATGGVLTEINQVTVGFP